MKRLFLLAATLMLAAPAYAQWTAASPEVAEAMSHPRVAAALAAANRVDTALVAGDSAAFISVFTDETRVNSPFNNVATRALAEERSRAGALTYRYLRRSIEYAGPRRDDEVVFMGEETYEPQAPNPHAGKTVRRRFTDVWRLQDGEWKLSLRQATIISIE